MEKFKLHARIPQNQEMSDEMRNNALDAHRQGMDPQQAAEELRAAGVMGEVNENTGADPISFANEWDLNWEEDNDGNVVIYVPPDQAAGMSLPSEDWDVQKDNDGAYVIYTNTSLDAHPMNEMYDDDDMGGDDFDMESLESEFPWLAKNVKTGTVPPELAAELAAEFGDKPEEEPEDDEPLKEGEDESWYDFGVKDFQNGRPSSPVHPKTHLGPDRQQWEEYKKGYQDAKHGDTDEDVTVMKEAEFVGHSACLDILC